MQWMIAITSSFRTPAFTKGKRAGRIDVDFTIIRDMDQLISFRKLGR